MILPPGSNTVRHVVMCTHTRYQTHRLNADRLDDELGLNGKEVRVKI